MIEKLRELSQRITEYLEGGGLWNPEMANHDRVRDLLMDIRDVLNQQGGGEKIGT